MTHMSSIIVKEEGVGSYVYQPLTNTAAIIFIFNMARSCCRLIRIKTIRFKTTDDDV